MPPEGEELKKFTSHWAWHRGVRLFAWLTRAQSEGVRSTDANWPD